MRDVAIVQRPDGPSGATLLRGALCIGPGHTMADVCKMLLTELQMTPETGWWELYAITPEGEQLASYVGLPPNTELLPRLPAEAMLLVDNSCAPRFKLPQGIEDQVAIPAPTGAATSADNA